MKRRSWRGHKWGGGGAPYNRDGFLHKIYLLLYSTIMHFQLQQLTSVCPCTKLQDHVCLLCKNQEKATTNSNWSGFLNINRDLISLSAILVGHGYMHCDSA